MPYAVRYRNFARTQGLPRTYKWTTYKWTGTIKAVHLHTYKSVQVMYKWTGTIKTVKYHN